MPPHGGPSTPKRTPMTAEARAINAPSPAAYARELQAFQPDSGVFSPGLPLTPPDPQPVRLLDFDVGVNTTWTPRAYEPFGFPQLRAFANVEPVRLAIETRKDQIERLRWRIKPVCGTQPDAGAESRIRKVAAFLKKPDGVNPFATWLRLSLEDLLVLDAPAWERRRTNSGRLIGLDVVPGDTIKPLVDNTGRRPAAPGAPAYQQVIKGRVWCDLTSDELLYAPRNPRPNHQYGLGPVEQIIVTITTVMKRQAAQLAYFTEGNIPAGILNAADGWSPDQLKQMQDWLDAKLSGDTAGRSKLVWVPSGARYQSLKDSPLKDDFDEWLYRIVAYAFSLPPTPFVRAMNKGTAGEDQDRGLEEGVEPIKLWVKRVLDGVIQDDLEQPDLEFGWDDTIDVSPEIQSRIDDQNLRNGSTVIDEVRHRRGQAPLPDGLGARPLVYAGSGPVLLEQALNPSPSQGEGGAEPRMGV